LSRFSLTWSTSLCLQLEHSSYNFHKIPAHCFPRALFIKGLCLPECTEVQFICTIIDKYKVGVKFIWVVFFSYMGFLGMMHITENWGEYNIVKYKLDFQNCWG
jgi:hypothetical protein